MDFKLDEIHNAADTLYRFQALLTLFARLSNMSSISRLIDYPHTIHTLYECLPNDTKFSQITFKYPTDVNIIKDPPHTLTRTKFPLFYTNDHFSP